MPNPNSSFMQGTPEATSYRLPPPTPERSGKKKRRLCFAKLSPEVQEWRRQTIGLPKNVIMKGDDGTLVRGKFVPLQSGHTGPVRRQPSHPSPNDTVITQHGNVGTRAHWVDAVMAGGIGAGPGLDPQYSHGGLQAGMNEVRRQRCGRRKERWVAWMSFVGCRQRGTVSVKAEKNCCVCSMKMWSCCPSIDESLI